MLIISFALVVIIWVILVARRRISRMHIMAERLGGPPGIPVLGHVYTFLRKEFLTAMLEMDALYSGIASFWFGHKLVVGINDPDLYEVVLNSKVALDKGDFYHFMRPLFGDGLIASDYKIWKVNRKVVSPTLNALRVKNFVDGFKESTDKLILEWETKVGLTFEPYADVSKTTFELTIRTALGKIDDLPRWKLEKMIETVNRISTGIAHRFIRPWLYPEWIFNMSKTGNQVLLDTKEFRNFLNEIINLKTTDLTTRDFSFVSHILDASKSNPEFSMNAVLDELSTYMTAGFETTSTAITFTLVMLGCHPTLQEKVFGEQNEIKREFSEINWEAINKMEYLERFIKESMRLFPVITVIGRQVSADLTVDSKTIPEGAFVMIPVYAMHRNENIWKDALIFNPDRFLPASEDRRHNMAYLPFGAGPRICLGQKYAMTSMKILLAFIVRNFIIRTNYSMDEIKLSKAVTLNTKGLTIQLEARTRH